MLELMKTVSTPSTHRRNGHAAQNGNAHASGRVQALALALLTQLVRRFVPSLRSILPPSRDVLAWQFRSRAVRRAEEQRRRERRRKFTIATASVTAGILAAAAVAVARALARR
jgi:hypothetical protein